MSDFDNRDDLIALFTADGVTTNRLLFLGTDAADSLQLKLSGP